MAEIQSYVDHLTSLYAGKPKITGWLTALLQHVNPTQECMEKVAGTNDNPSVYDVTTATGAALDVIGEIVGVSRRVSGNFENIYRTITIKWNQLAAISSGAGNNYVTNNKDGSYLTHSNTTGTQVKVALSGVISLKRGHRYYIRGFNNLKKNLTYTANQVYVGLYAYQNYSHQYDMLLRSFMDDIFYVSSSNYSATLYFYSSKTANVRGNALIWPQVYDLTEMFGDEIGSKITMEEFNKLFPEEHYPYSNYVDKNIVDTVNGKMIDFDDDTYRRLIMTRIASNHWNGKQGSIGEIFSDALNNDLSIVYHDNQDMSITADLIGEFTPLDVELVLRGYIIPKPMGVDLGANMRTETEISVDYNTFGGFVGSVSRTYIQCNDTITIQGGWF